MFSLKNVYKIRQIGSYVSQLCTRIEPGRYKSTSTRKPKLQIDEMNNAPRRVLCVAEKNDAAKNIAKLLSRNMCATREGRSLYNKLYCFEGEALGQRANIVFTSVSGHLSNLEFGPECKDWIKTDMSSLFSAPVHRNISKDMKNVEATLREESRRSQILIIWTDCDREGENIGAEIDIVCRAQNRGIDVYRAKFSEITPRAVNNAMQNLVRLDNRIVNAVDCRMELDLRLGAAFTRLQTLKLQRLLAQVIEKPLISYGSCQFPTLGFVVERYKEVKSFIPEQFWKLVGKDVDNDVDFTWDRFRLFDEDAVKVFLDICTEAKFAKVVLVDKHPKSKWRPVAMDTIELEKLGVRLLKMTAKRVMTAAEKLYTRGLISYPRTETNKYPPDFNLHELVNSQTASFDWGDFANEIIARGGPDPRNGNKSDQAHPPIHPLKFASKEEFNMADEWNTYELVVRHFLACVSRNATGQETKVQVNIADELFNCTGLRIEDFGYLKVYKYDKWTDKTLPDYRMNQIISKFTVSIANGWTEAPKLLSEADLIALMDKHGIGTDATHAEHIEKIKTRDYVALNPENRFIPSFLGLGLVDGYNHMGYNMSKPHLRAELESKLVDICNGTRTKEEVLQEQLGKYKRIFNQTEDKITMLTDAVRNYLNSRTAN
ncbi:DNA topoisomerase domain-containing protein [Ditylenchus destructor]|nr:DNA topoisomerase domain-containing protein [Ditylenchus destructor]